MSGAVRSGHEAQARHRDAIHAGVQRIDPIVDFPPENFRMLMTLMVEAPFLLIRAALPYMYAQKFGRVISISSVHGLRASEYKVGYVTAKHALEAISESLAAEVAPHGVRVLIVEPDTIWLVQILTWPRDTKTSLCEMDGSTSVDLSRSGLKGSCTKRSTSTRVFSSTSIAVPLE